MFVSLDGDGTLHRQVYRALRAEILAHRFKPGARLPSTRALAARRGGSRTVAMLACGQPLGGGYAQARTGSGTIVAPTLPEDWGETDAAAAMHLGSAPARMEPRLARAGTRAVEIARATRRRGT